MTAPLTPLTGQQQELVVQWQRLAYRVLHRHFRSYSRQPVIWGELQSSAIRGLMDAARRYRSNFRSPRTGQPVQFKTFAVTTIWGTINRRVERFLLQPERFRTPTTTLPLSDILRSRSRSPLTCAAHSELADLVRDFIRFLPPADALILRHRFGLDGTQEIVNKQIAVILGISRVRVGQRIAKILAKLRKTHWNRLLTMRRAI